MCPWLAASSYLIPTVLACLSFIQIMVNSTWVSAILKNSAKLNQDFYAKNVVFLQILHTNF